MMHLYHLRTYWQRGLSAVLILVVMDDALVLMNMMKSWLKDIDVLILVVMDDALVRENATATTFDHDTVLILVVMDDALVRI